MNIGVILSHDGASGGNRHLRMIASQLTARGHLVRLLVLSRRFETVGAEDIVPWKHIALAARGLDVLLGPGDLPLSSLVPDVHVRIMAIFLHLGVHDWTAELANIREPRIEKLTTARWIQREIRALGAESTWIGIAPLEEGLVMQRATDATSITRVGTLAHAWYGWKNTATAVAAYQQVATEFPRLELLSYGLVEMPMPGTFVLAPDLPMRQQIYTSCCAWLSPSISEGIGMAAFEAMQCGTPVISADNRGIREFADESTCAIYPPSDLPALTELLRAVVRFPEAFIERARRARRRVETHRWVDCMARIEAALHRAPLGDSATSVSA